MNSRGGIAPVLGRQTGQGMIEYGLILTLVAVVIIIVLITMGGQVKNMFSNVSVALGT